MTDAPRRLPSVPGLSHCWVCGPEHPWGLRLGFYRAGDAVTTSFVPRPEHQGYRGFLHGGLLTAVFDDLFYRVVLSLGVVHAVTARIEVHLKTPVRIGQTVRLRAELVARRDRVFETRGEARLDDGTLVAEGTSTYVEVTPDRLEA